jgi:hypothetical protein
MGNFQRVRSAMVWKLPIRQTPAQALNLTPGSAVRHADASPAKNRRSPDQVGGFDLHAIELPPELEAADRAGNAGVQSSSWSKPPGLPDWL